MILCWISSVLRRPQQKRPFQPDPKEEPCSNKCWRLDPQLKLEAASSSLAQPVGPVECAAPQADATASAQPPALHAIMALDSSSTPAKGAASPAKGATSPGKDTKSLAKDTVAAAAAAAAAARNSLKAQDSAAAGTSFDPAADGGGRMEAAKSSGASVAVTGAGKGDAGGSRGGAAESAPAVPAKAPQQPSAGALLLSGSL